MKQTILSMLAGAFVIACMLTSCRGKVTVETSKGTDSLQFDTDSISKVEVKVEVGNALSDEKVTDEEAIAFIDEFYAMDGWDGDDFRKYLGDEVLKQLEEGVYEGFEDVAIDEKYAGWDLLCSDPVGETDLYDISPATATGDGRYEKKFTTAYWGTPEKKSVNSIYYTVERVNGELKITKVEGGI